MKFDNKYFSQHDFSKAQIEKNLGGIEVTKKECEEYIDFVDKIVVQVKAFLAF